MGGGQRVIPRKASGTRIEQCPTLAGVAPWGQTWGRSSVRSGLPVPQYGPVELDWLETFLAVVDRGGFTAASAQVHRSQSRVSAHIAALERELGIRLIERGRRPAMVTDAGRVFAVHAREILAGVRTARAAVTAMSALSDQHVVVHTTSWLAGTLFPPVLADVLATFPAARVTLTEGDGGTEEGDAAGGAVLVVAPADREPGPRTRRQGLWWEPLRMLVPPEHPLARADRRTPDGLAGERLVLCAAAGRVLDDWPGLADRDRLTVQGPQAVAAMVRRGLGVGVVNATAIDAAEAAGLVPLDFDTTGGATAPGFEVVVDWSDLLLASPVGQAVHAGVVTAPVPPGARGSRR